MAGALAATLTAAARIAGESLRALMTSLPRASFTTGQMTNDLRRLRLAGVIRQFADCPAGLGTLSGHIDARRGSRGKT